MNCTLGNLNSPSINGPMAIYRRATSSGQQHLKESGHSFEDSQVHVLEREDCWFERSVKEAIHVKPKKNPNIFEPGWWPKTIAVTNIPNIHTVGQDLMSHHLVTQQKKGKGLNRNEVNDPANDP